MGLRKASGKNQIESVREISLRRNETLMLVAGRLAREYERNPNESLILEVQKLLEFIMEDLTLRDQDIE